MATPDDTEALTALHAGMSADNLRMRFFSPSRRAAEEYVEHLRRDPGPLALLVERAGAGWSRSPPPSRSSPRWPEVAFVVDDTLHGVGLGSLLLEHLALRHGRAACAASWRRSSGENRAMIDVFLDAGFAVRRRAESGTVHVEMDTVVGRGGRGRRRARVPLARPARCQPLLYPRSVAVTGVRRDGTGVGAAVLRSIVAGGFTGGVYAVHPRPPRSTESRRARAWCDVPGRSTSR